MPGSAFRAAIEAQDIDAAVALLHDDVVFRSPAVFKPYEGAPQVEHLLRTVFGVFADFRYADELHGDETHALVFHARVGTREVQGLDLIREDDAGRITEFTVMVRPASGLTALMQAMAARLGTPA